MFHHWCLRHRHKNLAWQKIIFRRANNCKKTLNCNCKMLCNLISVVFRYTSCHEDLGLFSFFHFRCRCPRVITLMIDSPSLLKILPTTTIIFSFHFHLGLPRSGLSTHFLYRKRTLCYFHVHRFMNIYWWAVFTARRCPSAVYMPRPCVRLCPSVCLSQVGVLSKRQERIELGFGMGASFNVSYTVS